MENGKKQNGVLLTFFADQELVDRVQKAVEKEEIERSKIIRKALKLYLDRNYGVPKK